MAEHLAEEPPTRNEAVASILDVWADEPGVGSADAAELRARAAMVAGDWRDDTVRTAGHAWQEGLELEHDLAAWLLEQYAEDERDARAAAPGGWEYCEDDVDGEIISDDDPHRSVAFVRSGNPRPGVDGMDSQNSTGRHISAWQPRRVLAECDAKRRIIQHCADAIAGWREDSCTPADDAACAISDLGAVVKLLALPYADRPGYREEWRP